MSNPVENTAPPPGPAGPDEAQAQRLVRLLMGACGVVCLLVVAINVVVNPLGYFPTRKFRPLTWSTRVAKSQTMARIAPCEVIVLGSSRSMQLDPAVIRSVTGRSAYNAAVDSAKAEDWLATTRYAVESLRWPVREILLGVDVEGLHNHAPPDGRLGGAPAIARHLPIEFQARVLGEVLSSSLSQSQLLSSIRSVRFAMTGHPEDTSTLSDDGMLTYVKFEREIAAGTFRPDLQGTVQSYDGRFAGMTALDASRLSALRALAQLASSRGIRVRAFVSPLHRSVVAHLEQKRSFSTLRAATVAALEQLRNEFPGTLSVVDYTDVRAFGGDPELFYDSAHIRTATANLLIHALLRSQPGHAVQ
jgi:hypothetical protein